MDLPFLKDKSNKYGSGTAQIAVTGDKTSDRQIAEMVASELIEALGRKDVKAIRESLKALYHSLKG
jgi:hypothetical protein